VVRTTRAWLSILSHKIILTCDMAQIASNDGVHEWVKRKQLPT